MSSTDSEAADGVADGGSRSPAPPVARARELGQCLWLDDLSRELLDSGTLATMIARRGVSGITTNPAIFEKAMSGAGSYDEPIRDWIDEGAGRSAAQLCEYLMLQDVASAADLLRPVFDASGGRDGYVSLEVSPHLAQDAAGTVSEALRLRALLGRPNLMIKVPATVSGLTAICDLAFEGVNVNATLIFTVETCQRVAAAWRTGLRHRLAANRPVSGIAAVASFFISRIDTEIDRRLEALAAACTSAADAALARGLKGRAAIASAALAYEQWRLSPADPAWRGLIEHGAHPPQLLWASVGEKDPQRSPTRYVDALVADGTISTLPMATWRAFEDSGTPAVRLPGEVPAAAALMARLEALGIRPADVGLDLQRDGIERFAAATSRLLLAISRKLDTVCRAARA